MMKNINCYNYLNNIGTENMTDEEKALVWDCFRNFVADTGRGARRARLRYASAAMVKPCGILRRLCFEYIPANEKLGLAPMYHVHYICGQEWNSEMATLRNVFDGK